MKNLLFVFSTLLTVLFFSCGQSKQMGSFTSEELSWLVYHQPDTLRFSDTLGGTHRLVVDYRDDFTQLKKYYPIEAEIELFNPDAEEHFRIYLLKDLDVFKKYLRVAEVYRSFDLTKPVDSVKINGQIYNGVYIFEEDTSAIKSDVWRVYFSREKGIVKYDSRTMGPLELISGQTQPPP